MQRWRVFSRPIPCGIEDGKGVCAAFLIWRTLNSSQPRPIRSEDSLNTFARSRVGLFAGVLVSLAIAGALKSPAAAATPPAPDAPQAKRSPLLAVMQTELDRSFKTLSTQDPAAYYISYDRRSHNGPGRHYSRSDDGQRQWEHSGWTLGQR